MLKIDFEKEIPKGSKAVLYFKFQAILNDKGIGTPQIYPDCKRF